MIHSHIPYDMLVQDALRRVVHHVLVDVTENGLPGDHHFFITFSTHMAGVVISSRLKERYPDQMTIVLQHQFWDLQVEETYFSVTLSFGDVPETLIIPFAAVRAFYDPAAAFEAAFDVPNDLSTQTQDETAHTMIPLPIQDGEHSKITILSKGAARDEKKQPSPVDSGPWHKQEQTSLLHKKLSDVKKDISDKDPPVEDKQGGDVVSLDAFRKK